MAGKLTPEEQQNWMKKMVAYANYVSITDDVIGMITKIVNKKMAEGTAKKAILASCDAIIAGLQKAYDIFKTGYEAAKAGNKPDFSQDVDFSPSPPSPPIDISQSISWFQLAWNAIRSVLNAVALKSSKLAEIMPVLTAAGDKLVEDLNKAFGKPNVDGIKAYAACLKIDDFPPLRSLNIT